MTKIAFAFGGMSQFANLDMDDYECWFDEPIILFNGEKHGLWHDQLLNLRDMDLYYEND